MTRRFKDRYERFGGGGATLPGVRAVTPGVPTRIFEGSPMRVVRGEWLGAPHPKQWGLKDDPRLPPRDRVMGISVNGEQKAYPPFPS